MISSQNKTQKNTHRQWMMQCLTLRVLLKVDNNNNNEKKKLPEGSGEIIMLKTYC